MKTNTWAELGRVTNYDFAKVRDLVVAGYTEEIGRASCRERV